MRDLQPTFWWPTWAAQIAEKLNVIHVEQHRNQERVMSEIDDFKAAQTKFRTEVTEAIEKNNETLAKLAEAVAKLENLEELKSAVVEATGELESSSKKLDDAFGTGAFEPSGMRPPEGGQ